MFAPCLRQLGEVCHTASMNTLEGRQVLVPADRLDDLLELARLAIERLPDDQLARSLKAATSDIRLSRLFEP